MLVNKDNEGTSPIAVPVPPPKRFLTVVHLRLFFITKLLMFVFLSVCVCVCVYV